MMKVLSGYEERHETRASIGFHLRLKVFCAGFSQRSESWMTRLALNLTKA
ncbi:MAG: hypothetical protein U0T74_02920 [Chitinophagales bacterium]